MARVFLSYDHEDVDRASPIASALEKAGHSVWWDRHIHGGAEYNDEIEAAVEDAEAVIVLWSARSVRSAWVRDEAAEGRDQGKLVPVTIDAVKPPMGFRQFQTIDCSRSNRGPSGSSLQQILDAINKVGGVSRSPSPAPAPAAQQSRPYLGQVSRRAAVAITVLALAAIAAVVAWNWRGQQTMPVVAIAAADSTPRSQALARDLFVKLGMLEHVAAGKWVLADAQPAGKVPDLQFRVAESGPAGQLQASVVLVDGKQHGLLWSRELAQSGGTEADVRQQLSLASGVALVCALEAREAGGLTPDLFKLYLASCADAAESSTMEPDKTVAAMRSIIAKRPGFAPAWGQLLAAQAGVVDVALATGGSNLVAARRTLLQDIEQAKQVAPNLPEINLVEIQLLPPSDYLGKLYRIAQAKAQAPDKAAIWGLETQTLMDVGRMTDAAASARRTAELEPLSPGAANMVVMTLAYGGQIEAAKKELAGVERKWAGTGALSDVQWAFHLRFGDPKIAMGLRNQAADLYLRARLEPTPENIGRMMSEIARIGEMDWDQTGYAIQALAEFDKTDEVYGLFGRIPASTLATHSYLLFRPAFDDIRRDRRFMSVTKRIGLLSYWQKSGEWPDFCYVETLPYDCKKEAARLLT